VSVNFRTFFWVLEREAALSLICQHVENLRPFSSSRMWLMRCDRAATLRAVLRRLLPADVLERR